MVHFERTAPHNSDGHILRPAEPFIARSLCTILVALLLVAVALPAMAGPRVSGRLLQVVGARKMVVIQRADGKKLRVVLRQDSLFKRAGNDSTLGGFRLGDYVVVEIGGALNDDPLDGVALMDVHTAGRAPTAPGSAPNTQIQGGFATIGGPAAPMPSNVTPPSTTSLGIGGSANIVTPDFRATWSPTQPWANVPDVPGQALPSVMEEARAEQRARTTMPRPAHPGQPAQVNAYGQNPGAPGTVQAPMTATPVAANNPWVGQVVSGSPNPQQIGMPNASAPVTTTYGANPYGANPYSANPYGTTSPYAKNPYGTDPTPNDSTGNAYTYSGPQGPQVVTLQGKVTQVEPARRLLMVQSLQAGQTQIYTVTVPAQVQVTLSRSRRVAAIDSLRTGDYVQVSGLMGVGGTVEARQLMVNK